MITFFSLFSEGHGVHTKLKDKRKAIDLLQSMPSYRLVGIIEVPGQVPLLISDTATEKGAHVEQGRP